MTALGRRGHFSLIAGKRHIVCRGGEKQNTPPDGVSRFLLDSMESALSSTQCIAGGIGFSDVRSVRCSTWKARWATSYPSIMNVCIMNLLITRKNAGASTFFYLRNEHLTTIFIWMYHLKHSKGKIEACSPLFSSSSFSLPKSHHLVAVGGLSTKSDSFFPHEEKRNWMGPSPRHRAAKNPRAFGS
jgi:hypothetical protein